MKAIEKAWYIAYLLDGRQDNVSISSTLHLKGFILTWMLLALPVVYLLRSVGSCVIYLAGISIWTIYAASLAGQAIFYFGLLARRSFALPTG